MTAARGDGRATAADSELPEKVAHLQAFWRRIFRRFESSRSQTRTDKGVRYDVEWKFRVYTERDELDGGWIAWVDGLPGCGSQGETEEQALEHLGEAFGLAISERMIDAPVSDEPDGAEVRSRTVRIA